MISAPLGRRAFLRTVALGTGALATGPLRADEAAGLHEPVHRVAKAENAGVLPAGAHPLDPALKMANDALVRIRTFKDYTATVVKRERIKGELGNFEFMFTKIRNRKMNGDQLEMPLSVYLNF
ncbi:MAG TPA: DUF1571 domain-containing protein, partial [Pseudoxanthomonas sp.]|nr:DUF1571 domain-containing protein [Pseudoxanthomonas sp.]